VLAGACGGGGEGPARSSALLVTLDTTRADALGCYGRSPSVTPHLDRLASESVVFDRAYTVTPITLPAHSSMMTGLTPPRHSVRENGVSPLPQSARTLAERARDEGVATAAFIAAAVLDADFGLDQGFDHYDAPAQRGMTSDAHFSAREAQEVVGGALAWLAARDRERPFFLWVHLFDPHAPYAPPPAFAGGAASGDPYLGEVASMDAELGRLFDALRADGSLAETTVLVVADHGEAFGEHDELSHATYCYEPTLRVPLFLRRADLARAGERGAGVVSVTDVHPTLADALGLAPHTTPGDLDGVSLFHGDPPPDRGAYFESYNGFYYYGWSPLAGWLDAGGKYIHSSTPQLFDVAADPQEARDLLVEDRGAGAPYRAAIARAVGLPALDPGAGKGVDDELLARIRALGYVGAGEEEGDEWPHPLAESELPGPQQTALLHRKLMTGAARMNAGDWSEAAGLFAEVLADDDANSYARNMLGSCLIQARRYAEAVEVFSRLIRDGRRGASMHYNLGISLMEVGRTAEAVAPLREAHELAPTRVPILRYLVDCLERNGRADEAAEYRARLERLAPTPR
jgi:arylsulfatase A-like enzyme